MAEERTMETQDGQKSYGTGSFMKKFVQAGVFFPAANVCNFMQGADPIASKIAIGNLIYAVLLIAGTAYWERLPPEAGLRKASSLFARVMHSNKTHKRGLRKMFDFLGRELVNPLRVTAYCALAVSGFLLAGAFSGADAALFPGLTGLFFGIGNFIQSSRKIEKYRSDRPADSYAKAFLHPAVWYGLGYTMTGITIGGGLPLLLDPLKDKTALLLTTVGVLETAGSLGLMVSGRMQNQAAPFMGVAGGTTFFAATGAMTGNMLGVATGLFACAGELSLAVLMQQQHNAEAKNAEPSSRVEKVMTAPLLWAMKRGLLSSTPTSA